MDQPPTSTALHNRTKDSITSALMRFENLIALTPIEGKDRSTAAVDTYQMEVERSGLVRAAEDLLSVSRVLKEAWLFGRLDTMEEGREDEGKRGEGTAGDALAVGDILEVLVRREREGKAGERPI